MSTGYPLKEILGAATALLPRILAQRRHRAGGPFAPPFKIKLFPTYRCNLRCVHCNLWNVPARDDELTTGEYEAFFRRNPYFYFVSFSGGEPTLRADLPDLIQLAARLARGPTIISVNLNGFLVERTVDAIRAALSGLDPRARLVATVSSDGPAEVHDHVRGHPESHARAERTLAGLRALDDRRLEVRRNICVSPFNLAEMPGYLRRLSAAGERHHLCFFQYGSHYGHTEQHRRLHTRFQERLPEFLGSIRQAERASDPLGRIYLDLAERFYGSQRKGSVLPCYSSFAAVISDPSGRIYPCINYEHELGGLRYFDFDLRKLLQHERSRRIQELILSEHCPCCWTPNEAYVSILCNMLDPLWLWTWLRSGPFRPGG